MNILRLTCPEESHTTIITALNAFILKTISLKISVPEKLKLVSCSLALVLLSESGTCWLLLMACCSCSSRSSVVRAAG